MTSTNQYLRASLLLAGGLLLAGPLVVAGCAGEADDPEDLDEQALGSRSQDTTSNPLTPVLTCMDNLGNNNYRGHFGYNNSSARSVKVAIGSSNFFVPQPKNQGQPVDFAPGNHPDVFSVTFSTRDGWDRLAWWLSGRRALATKRTPICAPPPPPQCTTPADCDDEDPCTTNTCTGGRCVSTAAPSGTDCAHANVCDGAGHCVECVSAAQCNDAKACTSDSCVNNRCPHGPAPVGTVCGHNGTCDAAGLCQAPACSTADDCSDEDSCTTDVCTAGTCSHSAAPAGTACAHGNVCNGSGLCVPCLTAADCDDEVKCTSDQCVNSQCVHGFEPTTTVCGHNSHCNGAGACSP